jgi:subtilisin family serine protease
MRRVRVNRLLNKRLFPSTSGEPLPEPLQPNDIITVVEEVEGEAVTLGNPKWLRTDKNFLVHSSGTSALEEPILESWALTKLGIDKIRADFGELGANARIVVLDSGITDHDDFKGRLVFHDVLAKSAGPIDEDGSGHGTSCCGIVGGTSFGVAPGASILAGRVMRTRNSPTNQKLAEGIQWALTQGNIDVISISISLLDKESILEKAVMDAINNGIVVVSASGNVEGPADLFPAAIPQVISTGAIDKDLKKIIQSADSSQLDLLAPGLEVPTTKAGRSTGSFSGTSAGTAYVAGCFALFRSFIKRHNIAVDRARLERIVKETATPYPSPTTPAKSGSGIINPLKTIETLNQLK